MAVSGPPAAVSMETPSTITVGTPVDQSTVSMETPSTITVGTPVDRSTVSMDAASDPSASVVSENYLDFYEVECDGFLPSLGKNWWTESCTW